MRRYALFLDDPRVVDALRTWGAPYDYADGSPATADDPGSEGDGSDCSGHGQEVLVRAGELPPDAPDRNANALAYICDPVDEGDEQAFDLVFYGKPGAISHMGVVVGRGAVLTAGGGTRDTHGDDPRAFVQLHRFHYRPDFVTVGRLKPAFRRTP